MPPFLRVRRLRISWGGSQRKEGETGRQCWQCLGKEASPGGCTGGEPPSKASAGPVEKPDTATADSLILQGPGRQWGQVISTPEDLDNYRIHVLYIHIAIKIMLFFKNTSVHGEILMIYL